MDSNIENGTGPRVGRAPVEMEAQHERDGGRVGEHNKYRTNGAGPPPVRGEP